MGRRNTNGFPIAGKRKSERGLDSRDHKPMPKDKLASLPHRAASFIEPMQCLSVSKLPTGPLWTWEIKMDGYRALAVKNGRVTLYSRLENSLNVKHPYVVEPLAALPDGTVVDGELVALDDDGRPNFNLMQKFREAADRIHYYVFDLLVLKGRDLTQLPLSERRKLLKTEIKIKDDRIRLMEFAEASSDQILKAVREQKLEGIIGKRADSVYEVGQRSGSVDKIQAELRAGVRDRRLHAGTARAGCGDRRLLSRQGFDLRLPRCGMASFQQRVGMYSLNSNRWFKRSVPS